MLTVLNYIGTKTTPYLRYIIEFTLYSTAFFALSATIPNLILFVIASFITLINITLLQNFTLRKDQFFCKSFQFLLLHKLVKIVSLSLGVISLNINISEGPFLVFVILQLLLGLVSIISYFNFGTYTFRHKLPRFLLFYLNILYCTASLAMFFDIVQAFENGSFNFFVLLFFCSLVSVYSMSCTLERKRRMSQVPENKNLK